MPNNLINTDWQFRSATPSERCNGTVKNSQVFDDGGHVTYVDGARRGWSQKEGLWR
jgi:hypothetical protein